MKHFVMMTKPLAELAEIQIVLNWFDELNRLVPID